MNSRIEIGLNLMKQHDLDRTAEMFSTLSSEQSPFDQLDSDHACRSRGRGAPRLYQGSAGFARPEQRGRNQANISAHRPAL